MINVSPLKLMFIGFVMMIIGLILPFAMVLRFVEPTLLLNFVAYLSSTIGLMIGLFGLVLRGMAQK